MEGSKYVVILQASDTVQGSSMARAVNLVKAAMDRVTLQLQITQEPVKIA